MELERLEDKKRTKDYVDKVFDIVKSKPGVLDVIILNKASNPVRTTMHIYDAIKFCGYYESLLIKSKNAVKKLDKFNEVLNLRVVTKTREIIITPDGRITIIVIHNNPDQFDHY